MLTLLLVLFSRILSPLVIFRHPRLGLILTVLADFYDFQILNHFNLVELVHYQEADKILDLYYFTIMAGYAFFWTNRSVSKHAVLLYFFKMLGQALFFLTGARCLFIFFPNFFEMFFIYVVFSKIQKEESFVYKLEDKIILAGLFTVKILQEIFLHNTFIDAWAKLHILIKGF